MQQAAGAKSSTFPVFVEGGGGGFVTVFWKMISFLGGQTMTWSQQLLESGSEVQLRTEVKSLGQGKV